MCLIQCNINATDMPKNIPIANKPSANCPQAALYCRKTTLVVVHRAARAKMAAELHPRSGKLIGLSNSNRTAQRNQPVQEFNHGLVLSREPLRDRDVFTVRIDKKVNKHVSAERERERGRERGR